MDALGPRGDGAVDGEKAIVEFDGATEGACSDTDLDGDVGFVGNRSCPFEVDGCKGGLGKGH